MPNLYLVSVYAIIWISLFVYLLLLSTRLEGLRREVEALKETVEEETKGEQIWQPHL